MTCCGDRGLLRLIAEYHSKSFLLFDIFDVVLSSAYSLIFRVICALSDGSAILTRCEKMIPRCSQINYQYQHSNVLTALLNAKKHHYMVNYCSKARLLAFFLHIINERNILCQR